MTFSTFRDSCTDRRSPPRMRRGAFEPAKPDACEHPRRDPKTPWYCNSTTCPRKAEWGRA